MGKRQVVVAVDAGAPVQEAFRWVMANLVREGDHVALVNVRPKRGGPIIPSATGGSNLRQSYLSRLSNMSDVLIH